MFRDLFKAEGYKAFMKKLLWMALAVLVIGVVFRLTHLNGGYVMILSGGGTLLVIGFLKLIEMIVENHEG